MGAEKAKDDIAEFSRSVMERGERIASEADAQVRSIMSSASQELSQLSDSFNKRLRAVGIEPQQIADSTKDVLSDLEKSLTKAVHDRPVRALAVAASIGLLFGLLSRR